MKIEVTTDKRPLLSVVCLTFNHELFIEQALNGFLMQKTNFPFEICIGEDESSDGTRNICRKFAERYPDRIRLFLRSRKDVLHINGRATGRFNFFETLKAARGKYIALCEGDDYWTDPFKLQKQVDFMQQNSDYTLIGHAHFIEDEARNREEIQVSQGDSDITLEMMARRGNLLATSSAVFLREAIVPHLARISPLPCSDFPMWMLCAASGKVRYLDETMSIYRLHGGGVWSSLARVDELKLNISLFRELETWFHGNIRYLIQQRLIELNTELLYESLQEGGIDNSAAAYGVLKEYGEAPALPASLEHMFREYAK